MTIIRYVPLMGILLIIYNVVGGIGDSAKVTWAETWKTVNLPSGVEVSLSYSEGFIILALIVLFIEIVKSTSASNHAITEQILSVLVFIAFLLQFLNSEKAGEPTFLILTLMSLLEVLAGFVILTKVARRDINFGGN